MAETLRIEIPIETIDKTEPEIFNVVKKLEKVDEAADNVSESAKKAGNTVSKFDNQAQKTEKSLASWAKQKYQVLLEAKEHISPILSTVKNGIKSFAGKTWKVTMRAVDLVTSPVRGIIKLLKNPIFQVGAVLGVSIGLKDTIDTYKNFEAAMSQVQAISGATSSELIKLTNKAKEMGATTKFTAEESAEAFNYMAMAGWKTEDMLGGIEGILNLAAASGESLATTSDIVTDALTAFGMTASDANHFADVLAVASSNANTNVSMMGETFKYVGAAAGALDYSIEDVALAVGLMANSGIKASQAGTELNSIFTRLSTNTNGARDAIEELGVSFFDSKNKARPFGEILSDLRVAVKGFTDDKQKFSFMNTVAGTRAQAGLIAMLEASEDDYKKLTEAVNNADGTAARMAEIMLDNLQGSITLLQSAADGVKISFGERLSPYIRNLADWLTEQMPEIEQGLDELMDWVDTKVDRMKRKFKEISGTTEWQNADFFGKIEIAWDEFIAEPFSEWWNSTGKVKFAEFAQNIGSGIGVGLKTGIMALLGIDIGKTVDEGASIGASFAKGFSEGFDFGAISDKLWQGFKNLLSSAGKLLPGGESAGLSSVMSAMLLYKIASPLVGMGKGAANIGRGLFGTNAVTGTSLVGSIIGSTGNAMVGGSGLLGTFANVGYGLTGGGGTAGMYFGSMAGTMSGSTAALVGAGSVAGGIAGAAGLIHGVMDLYTGFTSDDAEKAAAYKKAGAVEVGGTLAGAGAGAAAGAAIGAVFGGAGAVPGALIGAGVGAIGSWIAGNKIKEQYQENVEEMQKEAEKALKVFQATGLSIDDVRFKNEALTQAMNDSEVSAEQFAMMFQEECANVAKAAFGDITLSLAEVKKLASEITFADRVDELDEFAQATADTNAALYNLKSSVTAMKKEHGKVSIGLELKETDIDNYKKSIDNFISSAKGYIEDNHYEAVVALKLLEGEQANTKGFDKYYGGMKQQIEELSNELLRIKDIALEDGIVSSVDKVTVEIGGFQYELDEASAIEDLQKRILEVTDKLSDAQTDAQFQTLQIKHNGAALNIDSFSAVQQEIQAYAASASEQYENALTMTLTNLNLQFANGDIAESEYNRGVKKAKEAYYDQIDGLYTRSRDFSLESIATAWASELENIMPDIEGTTKEKLEQALNNALLAQPDVNMWTTADVIGWMGLDKLNIDTAVQETIAKELKQMALAVPQETKNIILQDFKECIPTAEEIKAAIDWGSLTNNDVNELLKQAGAAIPDTGVTQIDMPLSDWAEMFGKDYEQLVNDYVDQIHSALESSKSKETLGSFMGQYMPDAKENPDYSNIIAQYSPLSDENYETMIEDWKAAGTAYGDALNSGASESLQGTSSILRTDLQNALNAAAAIPFIVNPAINVNPDYNIANTLFPTIMSNVDRNAAGGFVSGGPQLSWLAEEGYGEFIIPTNPSRRSRALDLYEQAGIALGVSAHAAGGYVSGSSLNNEQAGYDYSEDIVPTYKQPPFDGSGNSSATIQVSVQVAPEFVINSNGQDEESIMQVIKRHMKEMADELGGEIAEKLQEVFSNMPLKEA